MLIRIVRSYLSGKGGAYQQHENDNDAEDDDWAAQEYLKEAPKFTHTGRGLRSLYAHFNLF